MSRIDFSHGQMFTRLGKKLVEAGRPKLISTRNENKQWISIPTVSRDL